MESTIVSPDLKDALDVHLDDVGALDRVPRLEEVLEDRVVEGLGAQQPDRQAEAPRDLAGTIASAIDGIALSGLVLQQPTGARFHALKVVLLSLVVTAYVTAGQTPPVARLAEMLSRHS